MLAKAGQRVLRPCLPVNIDQLVGECGEFVGEAGSIDTLNFCLFRVRVILLLHLLVQDLFIRCSQFKVHIIVASSDNL